MKHITTYKLFESSDNSIIETVKDLLLDLQDDEIKVKCDFIRNGPNRLWVKIGDINESEINLSKYRDQLYSVKEFLSEEGYKFHSFSWFDNNFYEIHGSVNYSYQNYKNMRKDKLFDEILKLNFNSLSIYFR